MCTPCWARSAGYGRLPGKGKKKAARAIQRTARCSFFGQKPRSQERQSRRVNTCASLSFFISNYGMRGATSTRQRCRPVRAKRERETARPATQWDGRTPGRGGRNPAAGPWHASMPVACRAPAGRRARGLGIRPRQPLPPGSAARRCGRHTQPPAGATPARMRACAAARPRI